MAPGMDYAPKSTENSSISSVVHGVSNGIDGIPPALTDSAAKPYYNARLDPKNYLEGPLSHNAATRLRQMLARPGIVVSIGLRSRLFLQLKMFMNRLLLASVMESVLELPSRPGSTACTKGK